MLPTLSSCVLCVVRDTGGLKYGLSCKQTFSFIFLTKKIVFVFMCIETKVA